MMNNIRDGSCGWIIISILVCPSNPNLNLGSPNSTTTTLHDSSSPPHRHQPTPVFSLSLIYQSIIGFRQEYIWKVQRYADSPTLQIKRGRYVADALDILNNPPPPLPSLRPSQPCASASILNKMNIDASSQLFWTCYVALGTIIIPVTSQMYRMSWAARRSTGHICEHGRFNVQKYKSCNSFGNTEQGRCFLENWRREVT